MKKKIINKQILSSILILECTNDIYYVEQNPTGWFYVTSKRGIDTAGNGVVFSSIELAITYVKKCEKNN